jgi:hypothetical protein
MRFSSVEAIFTRIQWATKDSQIAVFRGKIDKVEGLYAVFASTVMAQARIRHNDKHLVGVFYRGTPTKKIHRTLALALK